jgi:hypothetical protein
MKQGGQGRKRNATRGPETSYEVPACWSSTGNVAGTHAFTYPEHGGESFLRNADYTTRRVTNHTTAIDIFTTMKTSNVMQINCIFVIFN